MSIHEINARLMREKRRSRKMPINYDVDYPALMRKYIERGIRIEALEADKASLKEKLSLYLGGWPSLEDRIEALEAAQTRIRELPLKITEDEPSRKRLAELIEEAINGT